MKEVTVNYEEIFLFCVNSFAMFPESQSHRQIPFYACDEQKQTCLYQRKNPSQKHFICDV